MTKEQILRENIAFVAAVASRSSEHRADHTVNCACTRVLTEFDELIASREPATVPDATGFSVDEGIKTQGF